MGGWLAGLTCTHLRPDSWAAQRSAPGGSAPCREIVVIGYTLASLLKVLTPESNFRWAGSFCSLIVRGEKPTA